MGDRLDIRTAIYSRLGLGYGTVNDTKANRAINWAQSAIQKVPFRFLSASQSYSITEDKIRYLCPADFNYVDHVIIYPDNRSFNKLYPTRRENIEYYMTGYQSWEASRVYSADDRVIPASPLGLQYKCAVAGTSHTSEPAAFTSAIEGDSVTDNTVTWICVHETTGKGCPTCYAINGVELSSLVYYQNLWIGKPTADDGNYLAKLHYFKKLPEMDDAGETAHTKSLISLIYEDTPLISGACYKLAKDMEEEELAAQYYAEFRQDLADMKNTVPYKLGDDFSGR